MKQITNYIIESLHLNKDSKYNKVDFLNKIIEFLYGDPSLSENEEVNIFKKWIEDTDLTDLTIVCSEKELNNYGIIDNDNEVSAKDLVNKYKNEKHIDLILKDKLFIMFGDNVYDAGNKNKIMIFIQKTNNDKYDGCLTYYIKNLIQIYFIPKKMTSNELDKYILK